MDVKSGQADSEWWHQTLASVSAPFVSLLAAASGTANLWLADKQLIDYEQQESSLVYIIVLKDGRKFKSGLYLKVIAKDARNYASVVVPCYRQGLRQNSLFFILWEWFYAGVYKSWVTTSLARLNEILLYPKPSGSIDFAEVFALNNGLNVFKKILAPWHY